MSHMHCADTKFSLFMQKGQSTLVEYSTHCVGRGQKTALLPVVVHKGSVTVSRLLITRLWALSQSLSGCLLIVLSTLQTCIQQPLLRCGVLTGVLIG